MMNLKPSSHFLEKKKILILQILSFNNRLSLRKFSKKLRWSLPTPYRKQIRSQNEDGGIVVKVEIPRSSRTTIRCLAVVISRMVVASYDGNTGNATLIHPGQAERPLHRCSLLCANGQSWKNRKSYRLIPVIFIDPLYRRCPISLFREAVQQSNVN